MKKTIFVCDDDRGIVDVVKIVLEEAGYTVVASGESEKVFDRVKKIVPDLILLDLWMPGLRGEEVIQLLKKDKKTAGIPVLVISASKDTEEVANRAGADGFLYKPFDISALEEIVKTYVSSARDKHMMGK